MKSKYIALFVVGLVILSVSTYIVWPQAPTTPSSTTTDVTYEKTGAKTEFETIKGIEVPPEPDPELNNATLAGIDVNGNGVRDDVERWIVNTYPKSERTRRILMVMEKEFESVLLFASNKDRVSASSAGNRLTDAIDCLWYIRPDDASEVRKRIFAQTLSTKDRSLAYVEYNKNQTNGGTNRGPKEFKAGCTDFDPDLLSN